MMNHEGITMPKRIQTPLTEECIQSLTAGDEVLISGTLYTARDAAHQRLITYLDKGIDLPFDVNGQVIYYVGPCPAAEGQIIGSAGPTTSGRMDAYAPRLLDLGLKGMIGKGGRSKEVVQSMMSNGAVYFGAIGGAAALITKCILSEELVAFSDLGTEAIRKLIVRDLPVFVVIDVKGNNAYEEGRKTAFLKLKREHDWQMAFINSTDKQVFTSNHISQNESDQDKRLIHQPENIERLKDENGLVLGKELQNADLQNKIKQNKELNSHIPHNENLLNFIPHDNLRRIHIFSGHYGSGKSEIAVQFALSMASLSKNVLLADMDIVNPYFRSLDAKELMNKNHIQVAAPLFANTNVDVPAMIPEVSAALRNQEQCVILDVGGDGDGARILGRYHRDIDKNEVSMVFVLNASRPMTKTAELAVIQMNEIEMASRLKFTHILNNTHMLESTEWEDILAGEWEARRLSNMMNIPLAGSVVADDHYFAEALHKREIPLLLLERRLGVQFSRPGQGEWT